VLVDVESLEPRLAVELDDSSHRRPEVRRDEFKDGALKAAGMPMLRIAVSGRYADAAVLRRKSGQAMGG
jgi:very-short-patch-repair endonuclease